MATTELRSIYSGPVRRAFDRLDRHIGDVNGVPLAEQIRKLPQGVIARQMGTTTPTVPGFGDATTTTLYTVTATLTVGRLYRIEFVVRGVAVGWGLYVRLRRDGAEGWDGGGVGNDMFAMAVGGEPGLHSVYHSWLMAPTTTAQAGLHTWTIDAQSQAAVTGASVYLDKGGYCAISDCGVI